MCWKKDTHRCGRIKVLIVGFSFFQECLSLKEMINEAGVNAAGVLREGWLWSPRALIVQVWCAGQQPPECRLSGPSSDLPNPSPHFALGFMCLEKRFPTQLWLTALTERILPGTRSSLGYSQGSCSFLNISPSCSPGVLALCLLAYQVWIVGPKHTDMTQYVYGVK